MLGAGELTSMREEALRVMPNTCTLSRSVESDDSYGGWDTGLSVIATGVPVLVSPVASYETQQGARLSSLTEFYVSFPYGTDVRDQDRIDVDGGSFPQLAVTRTFKPESWDIYVLCWADRAT